MEREGWDYDDLDEDLDYDENNFRNNDSRCDCMVSERKCKSVQKRQIKKEFKELK